MKRNKDESFEDYKLRRSAAQDYMKLVKKGVLRYSPFANLDKNGKPTPYRNPEKLPCCCLT